MLFDLTGAHAGVAAHFRVGMEAKVLLLAGALDAFANSGGGFFGSGAGDIAIFDSRNFDVEIDAIEKRAGGCAGDNAGPALGRSGIPVSGRRSIRRDRDSPRRPA